VKKWKVLKAEGEKKLLKRGNPIINKNAPNERWKGSSFP